MPISVTCSCGKKISAPGKLAGKRVKCPSCQAAVKIPDADQGKHAGRPATKVVLHCRCGRKSAAPAHLAGTSVKCPGCGKPIRVPMGRPASPSTTVKAKAQPAPPPKTAGLMSLLDEVGATAAREGQNCPNCRSLIPSEAILCVQCGYHLESGKQLRTKRIGRKPRLGHL
jgi:hypothetical protein